MAKIPGWVYLIMGIIMILASQLIKDPDGSKSLTIFLYVGIAFLVIGVGKYIFRRGKKSKSTKDILKPIHINTGGQQGHQQQHAHQTHHRQHQIHHRVKHMGGEHQVHKASHQQPHQQHQTQHSNIISCQACGTRHYSYANFCMKCGKKIR